MKLLGAVFRFKSVTRSLVLGFISFAIGSSLAIATFVGIDWLQNINDSNGTTSSVLGSAVSSNDEQFDLSTVNLSRFKLKNNFYRYLSTGTADELLRVFEQADQIENTSHRREIKTAILRALVSKDAVAAVKRCLELNDGSRERVTVAVFEELARVDLDVAIAQVTDIDSPLRNLVISSILLIPVEPPRSLEEQNELIVSMGGNITEVNRLLMVLHIQQHRTGEHSLERQMFLDNEQTLTVPTTVLFTLAEQTLIHEGLQGIFNLLNNAQKWDDATIKRPISDAISTFALLDVKNAFKDSLTLEGEIGSFIRDEVLKTWAILDPLEALDVVAVYQPSNERNRLQRLLVQVWGQTTPSEALSQVDDLPRHLRNYLRSVSLGPLSESEPERAKQLVESIENPKYKAQHAQELVQFLVHTDPEGTISWVIDNPAMEDVRHQVLVELISSLVYIDPNLALKTAMDAPTQTDLTDANRHPYRYDWNLPALAIDLISNFDVDLALNMVSRVDEASKLESYQNIGRTLVRMRDYERALNLVDQLDDSARDGYLDAIVNHWAGWWGTQLDLVNHIDQLPPLQQSTAALSLLWRNDYDNFLSDSQKSKLASLLNEEDVVSLDRSRQESDRSDSQTSE